MQMSFDAFDAKRPEAARSANRSLKVNQGVVLAAGIMGFALIGLFPPWVEVTTKRSFTLVFIVPVWHSEEVSRQFAGYDYAFAAKPSRQDDSGLEDQGRTSFTLEVTYHWDIGILLIQYLMLFLLVTGALWKTAAWKNRSLERVGAAKETFTRAGNANK
jgi:hypothetical protein